MAYQGCISSAVSSSSTDVLLHELSPLEDRKGDDWSKHASTSKRLGRAAERIMGIGERPLTCPEYSVSCLES